MGPPGFFFVGPGALGLTEIGLPLGMRCQLPGAGCMILKKKKKKKKGKKKKKKGRGL